MTNLDLLCKIIHNEVGFRNTPVDDENPKLGFQKIPKRYKTIASFGTELRRLYGRGTKVYKGLNISWALEYLERTSKNLNVRHTLVLEQTNLMGGFDVMTYGKKKQKCQKSKK